MAAVTLFEMASQHGEIVAHMGKYLKRQLHTYDIVRDPATGDRTYRVYLDTALGSPIFEYRIPERTQTETSSMWAHRVKAELDVAWKLSQNSKRTLPMAEEPRIPIVLDPPRAPRAAPPETPSENLSSAPSDVDRQVGGPPEHVTPPAALEAAPVETPKPAKKAKK